MLNDESAVHERQILRFAQNDSITSFYLQLLIFQSNECLIEAFGADSPFNLAGIGKSVQNTIELPPICQEFYYAKQALPVFFIILLEFLLDFY